MRGQSWAITFSCVIVQEREEAFFQMCVFYEGAVHKLWCDRLFSL